jgi:Tol biopolymer transport system component
VTRIHRDSRPARRRPVIQRAALVAAVLVCVSLIPAAEAAFPGSNGRIVFASNRDGDYDIYTMRPDGSDVTQLTFNRAQDREPAWSPNGNRIAYLSGGQVWTMAADGAGKREETTGGGEASHPSWAPDGERIVFADDASEGGEVRPRLFVIDDRQPDLINLTPPQRSDYYYHATRMWSPSWSPRGQGIAVVIYYSICPGFLSTEYGSCTAVVLLNEDGSNPRALTVQDRGLGDVSWSPDGSRLAVALPSYDARGRPKGDLAALTLDGRFSAVTANPDEVSDSRATWSPDGTSLLFQTATPHSDYERDHGAPSEIALIQPDGNGRRVVGAAPSDDVEPEWQPKGRGTRPDSRAVMRLGRGVAAWKIGARRRVRRDFLRSERHRRNDLGGCVAGPETASLIDYYVGFRVSSVKGRRGFIVFDVSTSRAGDRSSHGFVIGQSRLRSVRARFPRALVSRRQSRYVLGKTSLWVYRRTGYESSEYLAYWFDGQGMLVALQTGESGC